jgi:2-keto-4-pentenoate hydratase
METLTYAEQLVAAHRGQAASTASAGPTDYASAMRVQYEVARTLGAALAGWKLGFSPDGVPVAGPLFSTLVQRSPARVRMRPRGYIVEVELAFRLARDLPPKPYTRDEVLAAVDEALIGVELVAGRFGEPPALPYLAFLADNIGNAGYVTGASTRGFRALDLTMLPMRFSIDGSVVEDKHGGHPQGDPVEPLRAYAAQPIDAFGGLRKGQIVTTGSISKPLRVEAPARIVATIDGVGDVQVELAG